MEKSSEEGNDEKIQADKITYMGTMLHHHNQYDNYHSTEVQRGFFECCVRQYYMPSRTKRNTSDTEASRRMEPPLMFTTQIVDAVFNSKGFPV